MWSPKKMNQVGFHSFLLSIWRKKRLTSSKCLRWKKLFGMRRISKMSRTTWQNDWRSIRRCRQFTVIAERVYADCAKWLVSDSNQHNLILLIFILYFRFQSQKISPKTRAILFEKELEEKKTLTDSKLSVFWRRIAWRPPTENAWSTLFNSINSTYF